MHKSKITPATSPLFYNHPYPAKHNWTVETLKTTVKIGVHLRKLSQN